MEQFKFFCVKLSVAAAKTESSMKGLCVVGSSANSLVRFDDWYGGVVCSERVLNALG